MKIRMLQSVPGSVDGRRVTRYNADQEYDLTDTQGARDLATAFVAADFAVPASVGEVPPVAPLATIEVPADAPRAAPARKNARTTK